VKISGGICVRLVAVAATLLLGGCAGSGQGGLTGRRADVVSAALSQVGTPYRYGGNAPGRGLDCSGLTHYAYAVAGVPIPRSSQDQKASSWPVTAMGLRPGDLVFFGDGGNVSHVGLMVDSHRYVHASMSAQKVVLASVGSQYWRSHFMGAGTYLK